ncbi:hypothetical protein [Pectobacterium brasiliense]|uniref:hypothetical protein n=1 Tax=Pectobacterium brasiliense TaxID=180957 RepID=UPI0025A0165C|nr:hypothetical protein [Pectobacterium brasiliense]WJM80544.1 hypothetical protein QTI90_20125 [Pectobacterium brasiliense]
MTLIEMEGFLRGKCIPRDMLVNESNAQYLLRKLTELQKDNETLRAMMREVEKQRDKFDAMLTEAVHSMKETEKQRDGLVAELNAVEKIHTDAAFITDDDYDKCPGSAKKVISSLAVMSLPASKVAIAEIGANAVELAIERLLEKFSLTGRIGVLVMVLESFAKELRGGGA